MEKKKLILTLDLDSLAYVRESSGTFREPLFCFAVPSPKGITTVTGVCYCRESFCEYVRQELRGVNYYGMDLRKLHMVVYRRVKNKSAEQAKIFANQTATAQKMFNVIEKHYGWPLTRVYPLKLAKDQTVPINNKFYYIKASKRWVKSPAMLSLYTLLIRIATNETKFKFRRKIRTMKSLFETLDDLAKKCHLSEVMYYKHHGNNWELILSNYRKLFANRTMIDLYFPEIGGYFFTEGINHLSDAASKDPILNEVMEKLLEKEAGKKLL